MTLEIDPAAVRWSAPPAQRAGRPLLVLLHGYGSDETDLPALGRALPARLVTASLRAPLREGPGYTWYPGITADLADPPAATIDATVDAVLAWLDAFSTATDVGLLGFSQGGAIAFALARLAPARFRCVVGLSTFVIGSASAVAPEEKAALAALPVFWGRGDADPRIPAALVERTGRWLTDSTALESRIYPGLAHAIATEELADVARFLDLHLRG